MQLQPVSTIAIDLIQSEYGGIVRSRPSHGARRNYGYSPRMDIRSIAQERPIGREWDRFLDAVAAPQVADNALFDGISDEDADQIERAVVDELARRGYLANSRRLLVP